MDVYKHGIQKEAQPLERLNRRFVEFQKRMVIMPTVSNQDQRQAQSSSTSIKKSEKKSNALVSGKTKKGQSKAFTVFNDEENDLNDDENMLPSADSANRWSEYANESTRVKENRMEPTPWTGATCPQKPVAKKSTDKFKVFKDEVLIYHSNYRSQVMSTSLFLRVRTEHYRSRLKLMVI